MQLKVSPMTVSNYFDVLGPDGLAPGEAGQEVLAGAGSHAPAATLAFDEPRASAFAKGVAGDFNPLHDEGHKRFCVPGDLLFAALVARYGARAETSVAFSGMLGARSRVTLPAAEHVDGRLHLLDERGREVLGFYSAGPPIHDAAFRDALVIEYVRFSGKTFPDILVPLMRAEGVMINPARPLIIYKDMAIRLDAARVAALFAASADDPEAGLMDDPAAELMDGPADGVRRALPTLVSGKHVLSVTGKKGVASLRFAILLGDEQVGDGEKNFVLSGLRGFDEAEIAGVVADYEARKRGFGVA